MDGNTLFLIEAAISLAIVLYLIFNYRKYRQKIFIAVLFVFGAFFLKSILYYIFNVYTPLSSAVYDPPSLFASRQFVTPVLQGIGDLKHTFWQFFETLLVLGYVFMIVPSVKLAQYKGSTANKIRRFVIFFAAGLGALSIFVIIASLQAGADTGYITQIGFVELIKKTLYPQLLPLLREACLIWVVTSISGLNEYDALNVRPIGNFKSILYWALTFEMLHVFFTWIYTPVLHHRMYYFQILSMFCLIVYAITIVGDMLNQLDERFQTLEKSNHLLLALITRISGSVGSESFDMKDIWNEIITSSITSLGARSAAIFLHYEEGKEKFLRAVQISGLFPPKKPLHLTSGVVLNETVIKDKVLRETIDLGEGVVGLVGQTGMSVLISDTKKDERYTQTIPDLLSVTSFMAVPLIARDMTVGVLAVVSDTRQFTEDDLSLLQILANFDSMAQTINDYSLHMNDLVSKKTAEVESLLEQQNGDYYLTSLLVKPLIVNQVKNSRIKVDFFLEQKKKFKFRKWNAEIGGDVCIAYSLRLRGRDYTVFANADAMGKSLQGAGGALVFGVVFISYVMRTLTIQSEQNYSPTEWLSQAYRELQTIFESFDGSMLISCVMGIIEDDSGIMWHFNCEHPYTVMYRNGSATFIEDETKLGKKLGTIGFAEYTIQENQLKTGDVLILGSDGRDDVMLGTSDEGSRMINEDEKLFLKHVETGGGNLSTIADEIEKAGELTDDLSLIRVYISTPDTSLMSDIQLARGINDILGEALQCYKSGDYAKGRALIDEYDGTLQPGNESFRFHQLSGNISFKQGRFEEAIESWRKALESNPSNEQLLKNIELLDKKLKTRKKTETPEE